MENIEFVTDKSKFDIDLIINFLHANSYWAKNRPDEIIKKSIANSFCIGVFLKKQQVGFARIVTDFATVYYLSDIFILPEYQSKGIGHQLMDYITNINELQNLRGILTTQTAHEFYGKFGFTQNNDIVQKRMMVK